MINVANVAQIASQLKSNTILASRGVNVSDSSLKASWITMIKGTFSLLFPEIHLLFPTRIEMQRSIMNELQSAFMKHHTSNQHIYAASPVAPGFTFIPLGQIAEMLPMENYLTKVARPTQAIETIASAAGDMAPDMDLGAPAFQSIQVYAQSPVNALI